MVKHEAEETKKLEQEKREAELEKAKKQMRHEQMPKLMAPTQQIQLQFRRRQLITTSYKVQFGPGNEPLGLRLSCANGLFTLEGISELSIASQFVNVVEALKISKLGVRNIIKFRPGQNIGQQINASRLTQLTQKLASARAQGFTVQMTLFVQPRM
jgi:hypothetical protein